MPGEEAGRGRGRSGRDGGRRAVGRRAAGADGGGAPAALWYSGISLVAAVVFWAVTTFTGSYPAVARYGGAVWVFILLMIVLMPIVIPRVKRRRQVRQEARSDAGTGECPLDVTNR